MRYRVGTKVPINVYDGDRPVCQCHNEDDASTIVVAMNSRETLLLRAIDVGWKAVHLPKLEAEDSGCEGSATDWCQMAVDAVCEARSQFANAIRKEFGLPVVERDTP